MNILNFTLFAKYVSKAETKRSAKENVPVFNFSTDFSIKKISDI